MSTAPFCFASSSLIRTLKMQKMVAFPSFAQLLLSPLQAADQEGEGL